MRIGQVAILSLDRDVCCGTAACVERAPHLICTDSDGLATLIKIEATDADQRAAAAAVEACPTGALSVCSSSQEFA